MLIIEHRTFQLESIIYQYGKRYNICAVKCNNSFLIVSYRRRLGKTVYRSHQIFKL